MFIFNTSLNTKAIQDNGSLPENFKYFKPNETKNAVDIFRIVYFFFHNISNENPISTD